MQRTTPTRVAISVTVNPIVSAIFGAYALGEPITVNLVLGLLLVAAGILVASIVDRTSRPPGRNSP